MINAVSRYLLRATTAFLAAAFLLIGGIATSAYAAGNGNGNGKGNGNGNGASASSSSPHGNSASAPGHTGATPGQGASAGTNSSSSAPASQAASGSSQGNGSASSAGAPTNDANGNKGHIQIEGTPDCGATPCGNDNDPHVGCTLNVQLFGYRSGTNTAVLTIRGQQPSGTAQVLTDTFDFQGAASPNGSILDTQRSYPLTASQLAADGLTANPQQGYHLRVEVAVNGNHAKTHVIWFQPCATAPTTPGGTPGSNSGPQQAGSVTPASSSAPDAAAGTATLSPAAGASAIFPNALTAADSPVGRRASSGLAFTGIDLLLLLGAAGSILILGTGAVLLSRRPERASV